MRARLVRTAAVVMCAGVVAALSAAATTLAGGSDLGVAYQVDVAHSGVQNDPDLAPPFAQRWQVTLPAQPSYPLIAQGDVYVTVGDNSTFTRQLIALDQSTGQVVWSAALTGGYPWSAPAYDAGWRLRPHEQSGDASSSVTRSPFRRNETASAISGRPYYRRDVRAGSHDRLSRRPQDTAARGRRQSPDGLAAW